MAIPTFNAGEVLTATSLNTALSDTEAEAASNAISAVQENANTFTAPQVFEGAVTIPDATAETSPVALGQVDSLLSGYATTEDLSSYAPLASPALTGTPTAPTAASGTNTKQLATTAFVETALNSYATTESLIDGSLDPEFNNVTSNGLSSLSNYQELQGSIATSATAGWTETVDLSGGTVQVITLNSSGTLAFSGVAPSGFACSVVLYLEQGSAGSAGVTWPSGTLWAGGTAPTLSTAAGAIDVITLTTFNGGTSWFGFVSGKGMAT